jgi:PTH2 family peptidyl-tRNA hydrolase
MKYKQVIVMRTDLGMRKGKMIAQGAHAAMGAIFAKSSNYNNVITAKYSDAESEWFEDTFTKICVRADDEETIHEVCLKAEELGLRFAKIEDSGRTEFDGVPTITCCAIGPAPANVIDEITGYMKLL